MRELIEGDNFTYTPQLTDRYTCPTGGAAFGPSNSMLHLSHGSDLCSMFLNIFSLDTMKMIATKTTLYAYNDYAMPISNLDKDGNIT